MKKTAIFVLVALIISLSFTSCSDNSNNNDSSHTVGASESAPPNSEETENSDNNLPSSIEGYSLQIEIDSETSSIIAIESDEISSIGSNDSENSITRTWRVLFSNYAVELSDNGEGTVNCILLKNNGDEWQQTSTSPGYFIDGDVLYFMPSISDINFSFNNVTSYKFSVADGKINTTAVIPAEKAVVDKLVQPK